MRQSRNIAFLISIFFLQVQAALACKCAEHKPFTKEQCQIYDVIFTGTLDSVSSCKDGFATAYFRIESLYKGKSEKLISVRYDCESDCQLSLSKDEKWLIYSQYYKYNKLQMEFCGRSRKWMQGADDFYAALNHMSWEEENAFLQKELGKQPLIQKEEPGLKERTLIQPSAYWKLGLVLISVPVLLLIFYFVKKLP
jgi:hypothetical protein